MVLVFMGLHLAKRNGSNNYFALLCGFVITATFWAFAQSWTWQVASLYVTIFMIVWIRVYKPMRPFKNLDCSIFVQLYDKHLSKTYDLYDVYIDYYGEKLKRFGDIIRKLRIIMIFLISCGLVIYCYQLIIGQVWWKWIIPAPVGLICLAWIIQVIRDFLNSL